MNDKLKSVLISLGMVGSAVIGGVAVDLSQPIEEVKEPVVEEVIKEPIVLGCTNVELTVEDTKVCLDKASYSLVKTAMADKYEVNGTVDINDLPLMIAVLDEEIKAQGGVIQVNGEVTFDKLVNQYLK